MKAELELLQEQNIIAPVTEPTEWCPHDHPKKEQIR